MPLNYAVGGFSTIFVVVVAVVVVIDFIFLLDEPRFLLKWIGLKLLVHSEQFVV